MDESDTFAVIRAEMVSNQIARRGLREPGLLQAFQQVPRHLFVPESMRAHAYEDRPLPIGMGQTISQPYIVAFMTSLLRLNGGETILEIGTGSGYQSAILSRLAGKVYTIERVCQLADLAKDRLANLGYSNVQVFCEDGSKGWPPAAPFNGILVTAAAAAAPQPLLDQLTDGGRLIAPVGNLYGQMLQLWTREKGHLDCQDIIPVSFVPLRGEFGWSLEDWELPGNSP